MNSTSSVRFAITKQETLSHAIMLLNMIWYHKPTISLAMYYTDITDYNTGKITLTY
jgi:hypothetical protein